MKKYRLKEEVKKYFVLPYSKDEVKPFETWDRFNVSLEALEEVSGRIELKILTINPMSISKKSKEDFTDQEKELCEAILNADETTQKAILVGGQLNPNTNWLDIDSLDDDDFFYWYVTSNGATFSRNVKAVLKQYLNEKK